MARVAFMGSKAIGLTVAEQMLATISAPHELVGLICPDDQSDNRSENVAIAELARRHSRPLYVARTASEADAAVSEIRPDVVIVAGWYFLIRLEQHPDTRFYGFHASPLPRYRGSAPLVWQLINGESEVGLSFFQFSDGIDDGPLVHQTMIHVAEEETIADVLRRVEEQSGAIIRQMLHRLLDGTIRLQEQSNDLATYCALRTPGDGEIDWRWSARQVHDFVRAQTRPYPGAFTRFPDGQRVWIWRTEVDPRTYFGVPGGVAERREGGVVITCGTGAVRVIEAEIEGSTTLQRPSDIFRSLRMRLQ